MFDSIKYRTITLIFAITILLNACGYHQGILLQHYNGDRLPPYEESTLHFRGNLDVQVDGKSFKAMNVIEPGWGAKAGPWTAYFGKSVLRPGSHQITSIRRRVICHSWSGKSRCDYVEDRLNCGEMVFLPDMEYKIRDVKRCVREKIVTDTYGRFIRKECIERRRTKCWIERIDR